MNTIAYSKREGRKGFCWTHISLLAILLFLQGCTAVNTFPTIARAGDTVSIMVGGSEKASKNTIAATLTDVNGTTWDLQSLGLVRSVFSLRTDGRAEGLHYSPYLDSYISWFEGHEPVQTVLVADLPQNVAPGQAYLTISLNANDNSSGISDPFTVGVEVIDGIGSPDDFVRQDGGAVDFARMEPAPYAKITFGTGTETIWAASLVVDFDETVLNPNDINLYVPESTVRGSFTDPGAFGKTQRMVYWHQDGQKLYVDLVAPQGIQTRYMHLYVIHPKGLSGPANLGLISAVVYDVDGNEIVVPANLEYFPQL